MGSEGVMGAEEDKGAAIYLMLDGQDTTGIGYMALWGFGAKCVSGVGDWTLDSNDYQSTCGAKKNKLILGNFRQHKVNQGPRNASVDHSLWLWSN